MEDGERYKVNVLDRAVAVLKVFDTSHRHLTLSEIAARANLHVSTCLRLLTTLRHHGLIQRDQDNSRYCLGYEILALAEIARGSSDLAQWARPAMRELCQMFDETVVLSIRRGDYRIDLDQEIGQQNVRRVISLGEPKPLYAGAASQVLMSGLSDQHIDDYLTRIPLTKLAENTITDAQDLRYLLARIRREGFAESFQQQSDQGGAGIAAGIFDARRDLVGAIGISVPQYRFTPTLRGKLIPAILATANKISLVLGGPGRMIA